MKKVLALVLALAMVMMMFVACKKQEQNSSADASKSGAQEPAKSYAMGYEKYDLACLYSEITGDFWSIVYNGCTAALEELKAGSGVTGYCVAPATSNDYTQQMDLIETAITRGVPIISSMGTGNRLDPSKFRITDLSKTSGCPLAKVMRRELRARGIKHHTVLASEELPLTPRKFPGQESERRTPPGSVSWVPPCAGMMIAGYIVQQLLAQKSPEHAPV